MFRVVRPGGIVVIEDSAQLAESAESASALCADYLDDDLAALFAEPGFVIESAEPEFVAKVVVARRP